LRNDERRLRQAIARKLEASMQRSDRSCARLNAQGPQARLARVRERARSLDRRLQSAAQSRVLLRTSAIDRLRARLAVQDPQLAIARRADRIGGLAMRLRAALARTAERRALRLAELGRTLNAVSPLATLDRGYAILIERESGRVVRSIRQAPAGTALRARVADGELDAHVDAPRADPDR
jgi:exodeoxyribonuclease VII large subunit